MTTDEGGSAFGERLRRLRVAAGLSQEALAERAGLSVQAIGALETGKRRRPYPHTVAALAEALGPMERERAAHTAAVPPSATHNGKRSARRPHRGKGGRVGARDSRDAGCGFPGWCGHSGAARSKGRLP